MPFKLHRPIFLLALCFSSLIISRSASADVVKTPGIESRFKLPQVVGNPFDFTLNNIQVTFSTPSGALVTVPAFFDGDTTWAARHMPDAVGRYEVRSVTLNGKQVDPQGMNAKEFSVIDLPAHGFVRVDPNHKMLFAFDDGSTFYPVGYNLAWRSEGSPQMPPLVDSLDRMGRAGVNWSRIWMNYWDGKNLDWPLAGQPRLEPGTLLLPVAKKWDEIVAAALRNHIYFQMVLQHHGQYSTTSNDNWQINPWNKANGGWLEKPEDFFTDARAIQLTKNKFRYIVARWGYAPSIMAFELCNEVESTDAYKKNLPSVAAWHQTMAKFIREQDHYGHLITTSSDTSQPAIWTSTDYYQAHAYPADLISAISGLDDQKLDRPYFYGEIGDSSSGPVAPPRVTLHKILWASLMSGASGAAEYWDWFDVEPRNLFNEFTSVQRFITQSGMLHHQDFHPQQITATTSTRSPLRFGPGRDWAASATTQFTVDPSGYVQGLGGMSAFLQGSANHEMFPSATFEVNYSEKGVCAIDVDQTTSQGATLIASIDGEPVASLTIGKRDGEQNKSDQSIQLNETLEFPVTAGSHKIGLENKGADWIHLRQFTFTPYTSELAVLSKATKDSALLWIYRREPATTVPATPQTTPKIAPTTRVADASPITGQVTIPGLANGSYRVVWWDTHEGSIVQESSVMIADANPLTLQTPPVTSDIGCWIEKKK